MTCDIRFSVSRKWPHEFAIYCLNPDDNTENTLSSNAFVMSRPRSAPQNICLGRRKKLIFAIHFIYTAQNHKKQRKTRKTVPCRKAQNIMHETTDVLLIKSKSKACIWTVMGFIFFHTLVSILIHSSQNALFIARKLRQNIF